MPAYKSIWQVMRVLKWVCWIGAVAYYIECLVHRDAHQDAFRQLYHTTEFWIFGLPLAATFFGLMEMASREKAGIARPPFLRNWSGKVSQAPAAKPGAAQAMPR